VSFRRFDDADTHVGSGNSIHLFRIPPDALSEVILGYRVQCKFVKALYNAVRKNPCLHHVTFAKAELIGDEGLIVINPVSIKMRVEAAPKLLGIIDLDDILDEQEWDGGEISSS